ncbi:MAG: PIG-L family deacetylase [Pyrinomonadaceae bacterium]
MTSRLLEVEGFRHDIIPQPLPVSSLRSVLLLAPHCDDEVIGAGGTLLLGQKAGVKLGIVYCTDSQQNNVDKDVRRRESQIVCERLGAEIFELNISNLAPKPLRRDLEKLNEIICATRPDVILCPWLLDGAPKHRMVNHLLWLANRLTPLPNVEIWGYQVQNTLLPNGFVDITCVSEEKRALLECFPSQNKHRHWDHVAMGLAAWNSRLLSKSDSPRFVETFLALPAAELLKLIEDFYFTDLRITYAGEPNLAVNMETLRKAVTEAGEGRN